VAFVQALNAAVCFGAPCSGDREQILALCSFQRELTQLIDWAEQLSTVVGETQLTSDLTKVLDITQGILASPLEPAGGSLQPLNSAEPKHEPSDQLSKVARSMDLHGLAAEMQGLTKLAERINGGVEDEAVQLADALNEAIIQNTRASGKDASLMNFSLKIEAELKQLEDYAGTLAVFVENKKVISDLSRMDDAVKTVKDHLLRRC
jgi:hypothetical protein